MNTNTPINTKVSPSLHPETITAIEGYDESTAPLVGQAVTVLDEVYQGMESIHTAKAAAAKNPTLNDAAALIAVGDFAFKVQQRAAARLDTAVVSLTKMIDATTEVLKAPVTSSGKGQLNWLQLSLACAWGSLGSLR